ncbi:MAG TPA: SLBB domain-containing protein [Methylibium sp.]|uniref:SLBB domain-containing protein n=1 Tax=Methylibium sp. TaxID=2067992 RepID=UPI002DB563CD|nr:SLBB domain-containing protein [Methylibium sp.]HEU4460714.1 SLBB domain-containing protein [Methylibium sp.]
MSSITFFARAWAAPLVIAFATAGFGAGAWAQRSSQDTDPDAESDLYGPVQLRQQPEPNQRNERPGDRGSIDLNAPTDRNDRSDRQQRERRDPRTGQLLPPDGLDDARRDGTRRTMQPPAPRGEFELFVQRLVGPRPIIRRFGAELVTQTEERDVAEFSPLVPADYVVKPGDEILLTLWGSVNGDLKLKVDRTGRVSIPRVGSVQAGGVKFGDLPEVIERRVAQVFKNFQLNLSLGQLRGVRVYLTGFVNKPGAYSVSSLSTLTQALLAAGGPAPSGSFRDIELRRGGKLESRFDLYDFLLRGNRESDRVVQPDDVIHVGPVGPQVALIGSVNRPAVFELKPGETVSDVLAMAGGLNTVGDPRRLTIERLEDRGERRIVELNLPAQAGAKLLGGDVLRAFSAVDATLSVQRQNKRVRIEGEVARPGDYVLPPNSSVNDAIQAAGGLTPGAYVFGTEFKRESVRITQQENYDRALRELEVAYTKAATSQRIDSADQAAALTARSTGTSDLVDKLRKLKPNGRVVLQLQPSATELPNLALEDADSIYIPPVSTTVGVFGSVYNAGSFLWSDGRTASDFLQLAGGPTDTADARGVFVIRANGSVVSSRQRRTWFGGGSIEGVQAQAGDTIFVPDEVNRTTWVQDLKDLSQIFYQLGLGAAAVTAIQR